MAVKVEMPKLSDTQEEGVLANWKVQEGDEVSSGDVIAEVETDKATMDVEVFDDGTILKIVADEGEAIPLGGLIAVIGEEDEDISDILEEAGASSSGSGEDQDESDEGDKDKDEEEKEEDESKSKSEAEDEDQSESEQEEEENENKKESSDPVFGDLEEKGNRQASSAEEAENGRLKASPLAKKMAKEQDISLSDVKGSGPHGRIVKKDIEGYESSSQSSGSFQAISHEDQEHSISQMRKTIARRLAESKYSSPHFYETVDIDMQSVWDARKKINEVSEVKISFNDIVVKACSKALRKHPQVNSSWLDDKILEHGDVNIAVAVAIDEGLITPVINNADQKGLQQISQETKELAELSRNRDLQPEQMEGSTFTVSNLGMFGIEEFTGIINPPNACILAVGAIREEAVVEDGEVVPGRRMKVTLSSDHRIVDGATAAKFLNTLRNMLENPLGMLL